MHVSTAPVAALLAGVLLAGLSACAGTPTALPTAEAGTTDMSEEAAGEELEPGAFMDRVIEAQLAAGSVRMSLEMTGPAPMSMDGAMVYDGGDGTPALGMTMDAAGTSMEMILVGGQLYLRIDGMTDGRYLHVDPTDASSPFAGIAAGLTGTDPVQQTKDVRDATTSVAVVGDEQVDGVASTHYVVTVDPAKVTGKTAESFAGSGLGIDEIVYDYWLDERDLPVQVAFTVDVAGTSVGSTMKMRDWGAVPAISAPAAEQIVAPEELGLTG